MATAQSEPPPQPQMQSDATTRSATHQILGHSGYVTITAAEPEQHSRSTPSCCHLRTIGTIYDPKEFAMPRDPPLSLGFLRARDVFARPCSIARVEDLLLKLPNSSTYALPLELAQFEEALQLAVDAFHRHVPDASGYHCYLSCSTMDVPAGGCQRFGCVHADGVLGSKHRGADGRYTREVSTFVSVASALPTVYHVVPVDVAALDPAADDYSAAFATRLAGRAPSPCQRPFELALWDGYTLHCSPPNAGAAPARRIFCRVEFCHRLYDDATNTRSACFAAAYPPPVAYPPRYLAFMGGGGWTAHAIQQEHQRREKEARRKKTLTRKRWARLRGAVHSGVMRLQHASGGAGGAAAADADAAAFAGLAAFGSAAGLAAAPFAAFAGLAAAAAAGGAAAGGGAGPASSICRHSGKLAMCAYHRAAFANLGGGGAIFR